MEKKLEGKVAVVVGSTSGIGQGVAEEYAAQGAKVVVTGRREEKGEAIVKAIEAKGGVACFMKLDVTCEENVKSVMDETVAKYGKLDVVVINAGVAMAATMEDLDTALWDKHYNTNIRAHFWCAKYALPYLLETKGNIVFTSSMAAIKVFDQQFAYGSTKAAVSHFAKMLAISYADKGVRVNAIAPGVIDTDILAGAPDGYIQAIADGIPMKRIGQPSDVAKLATFLASDDASYITGQVIACCGGASLV